MLRILFAPNLSLRALLTVMLTTAPQVLAGVNPATVGYCVAVSDHVAQQLRQSGRAEMAERLMGANARLQGLLDTPEKRHGFERAFEAVAPERFTPQRIDQAITQCSEAYAATS